jgi:hypothetical protein
VKAQDYAAIVAAALPGSPEAQALIDAATDLDAALAGNPAEIDVALAAYRQAFAAARDDFIDAILASIPMDGLKDAVRQSGLLDSYQLHAQARLGPLLVGFTTPSATLVDPRSGSLISVGPMPPNAFQAALDTGPVKGAGSLVLEGDHVAGLLSANAGTIEVAALASFSRTAGGGPSFLAALSAGFTPGLQLGFGFQINRIGGIIGVERSIDTTAIANNLKNGTAAAVLFPLDSGPAARAALQAADRLFPLAGGSAVAGPTARLAWLEVSGAGFASVDIAVLVQLPGPRIAIVGVFNASIPGATSLMRLRADLAGVLDFPAQRATVDACLHDSGVLGIFTVYGDLAFASSWGPSPYTVLSLGGFYPGFRPEPAQIRPLSRLGMSLDNPLPGLRLRAEGYLAATSNTLQLGGRLDLGFDAGIASVSGFLGVDSIIQFSPFHFNANTTGGLDVRFLGETFAGVRFDGVVAGPGPVTLYGKITVETFIKDFDWDDTFVFGRPDAPPGIPPQRAAQILVDEEFRPSNIRALGGADPSVLLSAPDRQTDLAVVAPLSGLVWSQHRVPFDLPLDRVDGTPLGTTQSVHASAPGQTSVEKDLFSPGSYITLTQSQALAAPSYELLPSGLSVAAGATLDGHNSTVGKKPQLLRKVRGEGLPLKFAVEGVLVALPDGLLCMVQDRDRRACVADREARVSAMGGSWKTIGDGATYGSATQAVRASTLGAGPALTAADAARPIAIAGL